ncbi:hypothetical protein [Streptomyces sp. NPDC056323]|uniref:hypothetical protein n=1 Tax=Streptomyces sp. NPDC056323 TaxID=3345784 RepID=UPI0035D93C4A
MVAVADDHATAVLVGPGRKLGHVLVDFHLQHGGEQSAGAFADGLVDQGAGPGGAFVG